MKRPLRLITPLASLIVPFILWPIVFGPFSSNFWPGLAGATGILLLLSLLINRKLSLSSTPQWLLLGAASGILLYGFFDLGFQLTKGISAFSTGIGSIYLLKGSTSPIVIGLLLIFPIGPGEEIYWRGLIQRSLDNTSRKNPSWVLQAIPYTLIHLFTLNPPLLITALIGGLAWGYLNRLSGSITPCILSHVVFDLLIFVVLPFS